MTLPHISLGHRSGLRASAIGLGCSRLGSTLGGCAGPDALRLLRHALDSGVTLLDTANIYGQGESERLIGEAVRGRRDDVVLVTKAGQRFTPAQRAASLVKAPLRFLAGHVPALRRAIAGRRAGLLPRDVSPEHLRASIEASLRRLRTDRIDLFLLHSPSAAMVRKGAAFTMLDAQVKAGKLRAWGISCDDAETVEAALRVPSAAVLQVPLAVARAMRPALDHAAGQGAGLMLREIFAAQAASAAARAQAIAEALGHRNAIALVGTTSPAHLDEALRHARQTLELPA